MWCLFLNIMKGKTKSFVSRSFFLCYAAIVSKKYLLWYQWYFAFFHEIPFLLSMNTEHTAFW